MLVMLRGYRREIIQHLTTRTLRNGGGFGEAKGRLGSLDVGRARIKKMKACSGRDTMVATKDPDCEKMSASAGRSETSWLRRGEGVRLGKNRKKIYPAFASGTVGFLGREGSSRLARRRARARMMRI